MLVNCNDRKNPPDSRMAIITANGTPGMNVAQAARKALLISAL